MIFVTVGTNEAAFDRLLRAVEQLDTDDELLVQHGPSLVRPAGAKCVDYLPFEALVDTVARASVVVMHAGVGSIVTALAAGKRPVVVPRLRRFGEAVDDHQLPFGRRAAEAGIVSLVEDLTALAEAIAREQGKPAPELRADPELVRELQAYLQAPAKPYST